MTMKGGYGSKAYEATKPYKQCEWDGASVAIPAATAVADGATKESSLVSGFPGRTLSMSGKSSVVTTMRLIGYLDAAGTIAAFTQSAVLVANTPTVLSAPANVPFQAWKVTFQNASGGAGTCEVLAALAQA